jgi:hypothetical protein
LAKKGLLKVAKGHLAGKRVRFGVVARARAVYVAARGFRQARSAGRGGQASRTPQTGRQDGRAPAGENLPVSSRRRHRQQPLGFGTHAFEGAPVVGAGKRHRRLHLLLILPPLLTSHLDPRVAGLLHVLLLLIRLAPHFFIYLPLFFFLPLFYS